LGWSIEFEAEAKKDLAKLDKQIARRITGYLRERVSKLDNPRALGHALSGSTLGEFWRYRVGDYRILVVGIGNRREIYR
jgi:mRNA interferase RelE/StbE